MPVAIDTSALLRRYLIDDDSQMVLAAMESDQAWTASALVRLETQLTLHRLELPPSQRAELWQRFRSDWDEFWVVPLDDRCLARATELGSEFGLSTVDSLHLAAADRLARPLTYLTFDSRQIPAALGLGFEVVSALAG